MTTPRLRRCKPCDKSSYAEHKAFSAALLQSRRHGKPFSAYPCPVSTVWHLSTTVDPTENRVGTVVPAAKPAAPKATGPFIVAPPLEQARRYADAEIRGRQTAAELEWLHSEPLLWLQALNSALQHSNTAAANGRQRLAELRPVTGASPSAAYLKAKAEFDRQTPVRQRFDQNIRDRIESVRSFLGTQPVNGWVTAGELADSYARIASLIGDGDFTSAHKLALRNADRWAKGLPRLITATPAATTTTSDNETTEAAA